MLASLVTWNHLIQHMEAQDASVDQEKPYMGRKTLKRRKNMTTDQRDGLGYLIREENRQQTTWWATEDKDESNFAFDSIIRLNRAIEEIGSI